MNQSHQPKLVSTAVSLATNRELRTLAAKRGMPASKLKQAPHASQLLEATRPYNMPLLVHLRPEALAAMDARRGNHHERGEYLRRVIEWGLRQ